MNRKNKILSILLIIVMMATIIPAMTVAAETEPDDAADGFTSDTQENNAEASTTAASSDAIFMWPLDAGITHVDSPFGFRRATGRTHLGIDVVQPVGTPVYAAASGTVRTSTREGAWGHLIIIDHDYPFNQLSTFYAHLNSRVAGIVTGVRVEAGQLIGTVGRTGNASAPHLHFELRLNNMPVNPMPFFHANETRADSNPNPVFISQNGRWVFNPAFDPTFTVHEYSLRRQGNSTFLLPYRVGEVVVQDPAQLPYYPQDEGPGIIFDPYDLGFIPQTPDIIDSFAFGASEWAASEIDYAIRRGIIPENLLYDFQDEITRAEFAETAVRAILVLSGALTDTDEDEFAEYVTMLMDEYDPFDDTDNVFVIIAHYLHIVNGVGERTFAPDNLITRQEAAAMLTRIAAAFDYMEMGGNRMNFVDSRLFAPWATDAIEFVSTNGIMGGIGNNEFSPLGLYTREQTFVTMIRLAEVLG